jgi:hypothetical protein
MAESMIMGGPIILVFFTLSLEQSIDRIAHTPLEEMLEELGLFREVTLRLIGYLLTPFVKNQGSKRYYRATISGGGGKQGLHCHCR